MEAVKDTKDPVEIYLREVYLRLKVFEPKTVIQKAVSSIPHRSEWFEKV